jgi:hypothetical protein
VSFSFSLQAHILTQLDYERDPEAVGFIEDMVLDYLTQLNEAAFGDASRSDSESSGDEESQPPLKKSKVARPKIEVRIANRKKGVDENGLGLSLGVWCGL